MNHFDEIREEMKLLPKSTTTVEDVFDGLEFAHAFTSILRAIGREGERQVFLKYAAIAVRGLEFADAEIEAAKEDDG